MISQHIQSTGKTLAIRYQLVGYTITFGFQPTIINDHILVTSISISLGGNQICMTTEQFFTIRSSERFEQFEICKGCFSYPPYALIRIGFTVGYAAEAVEE